MDFLRRSFEQNMKVVGSKAFKKKKAVFFLESKALWLIGGQGQVGCGGQGSYVSPFSEMAAVRMNEGCRTPGSPLHTDADQAALGQGLHHLS